VKPTAICSLGCLGLLFLSGAGCLGDRDKHAEIAKPPAAELVEPSRVRVEEVNEGNYRQRMRQLDSELTFDERATDPDPKPAEARSKR